MSSIRTIPTRRAVPAALVVGMLLTLLPAVTWAAEPPDPVLSAEWAVLSEVNRVRENQGLGPLRMVEDVREVSRERSRSMKRLDYFGHVSPSGADASDVLRAHGRQLPRLGRGHRLDREHGARRGQPLDGRLVEELAGAPRADAEPRPSTTPAWASPRRAHASCGRSSSSTRLTARHPSPASAGRTGRPACRLRPPPGPSCTGGATTGRSPRAPRASTASASSTRCRVGDGRPSSERTTAREASWNLQPGHAPLPGPGPRQPRQPQQLAGRHPHRGPRLPGLVAAPPRDRSTGPGSPRSPASRIHA